MKCVFFLWSQRSTSLEIEGWARFATLRHFLRECGVAVSVYFAKLQPRNAPRPDWLAIFARQEKVPLEEFGELRNWRGMGIIALGDDETRRATIRTLDELLNNDDLQRVLRDIETRAGFGASITAMFGDFRSRQIEDHLGGGQTWTNAEINEFNRMRTALGHECLRLLEEELFDMGSG